MKDDGGISFLNQKSSSEGGAFEIAANFTKKLNVETALQNPWVTWQRDSKVLGELIYRNRNRKLSGLVIGVKDVISTSEFPTRMGTNHAWMNPNMGFDARVVSISKELGAVIGGKTKTSEFAVHKETDVINPKYPEFTAGTSSAGSAAAVANGTADIALATQTAGSIARPSSYCGVVGFKPTFGDLPRTGVLKTTDDFDTIGMMGRDLNLVMSFYLAVRLSGADYPIIAERRKSQKITKFTILTGKGFDSSSEETSIRLQKLCAQMNLENKFDYVPAELFESFVDIRDAHETIYRRDLFYYFQTEIANKAISSSLVEFINSERLPTKKEYESARTRLASWQHAQKDKLSNTLIVSLAASSSAPIKDPAYEYDLNAVITAAGMPQLSIPGIMDSSEKNINISLCGSKGSDLEILNIGKDFSTYFSQLE
jgi:Asp-tRNA(Asn)/Glu-tRNA(Gln) amidotransferase A subunit family amidase